MKFLIFNFQFSSYRKGFTPHLWKIAPPMPFFAQLKLEFANAHFGKARMGKQADYLKRNLPKVSGFTLIEMLIVIAIITILASIVLVGLGGFGARGRDTKRIADLRQVQNGLQLYYVKNQVYPDLSGGGNSWVALTSKLKFGGIGVSVVPTDPQSPNKSYDYGVTADGQNYVLKAMLEDPNSTALRDSVRDANVLGTGVDCSPAAAYCVQF